MKLTAKPTNLGGHKYFFAGPLIPLFWTSGDISSGFQSQSGKPPYKYLTFFRCFCLPDDISAADGVNSEQMTKLNELSATLDQETQRIDKLEGVLGLIHTERL